MKQITLLLTNHSKKFLYLYLMVLVLLSVLPLNKEGSAMNHTFIVSIRLDYLMHFAVFIPLMFLIQISENLNFNIYPLKTGRWLLAAILFAAATESIQFFLPYRAFNINDLLSNIGGVVLGAMLFFTGLVPVSARK